MFYSVKNGVHAWNPPTKHPTAAIGPAFFACSVTARLPLSSFIFTRSFHLSVDTEGVTEKSSLSGSLEPPGLPTSVLIVDDDQRLRCMVEQYLARKGFGVVTADSCAAAREQAARSAPDIVLLDLELPDGHGTDLLRELRGSLPHTQFIMITGFGSIRSAIETTREGASDYLTKPFRLHELSTAINSALDKLRLRDEVDALRAISADGSRPTSYPSAAYRKLLTECKRAAETDGIVLLLGESGSGKDRVARWIHNHSARQDGSYFAINCAAVAPELAESELFGHEAGAYTGARGRKRGMVELANDGTLLLNEVGELDLALQSKLLTFLDTRTFIRVGGERKITISARVLAATNRDLQAEVAAGRFRSDLFYRLNVFPIRVPTLRERPEDIPLLVQETLAALGSEVGRHAKMSREGLERLNAYHWPGNVRELRNVLERALILAEDGVIQTHHILLQETDSWRVVVSLPDEGVDLHDLTRDVARQVVLEALRRTKTKQQAADLLGLTRHALNYQLTRLGIDA
jgi:DNA-binding NtrC family response regulator